MILPPRDENRLLQKKKDICRKQTNKKTIKNNQKRKKK